MITLNIYGHPSSPEMSLNWSPKLPVEVVESIFERLYSDDCQSLCNCALTCRPFLLIARIYLFRDITIFLEPTPPASTQEPPANRHSRLLYFLAFDSHVAYNIRTLRLQRAVPTSTNSREDKWAPTIENLGRVLPKMNSLQRLSIHSSFLSDWTLEDDKLHLILMQFSQLPSVRHLELFYMALFRWELPRFLNIPNVSLIGTYVNHEDEIPGQISRLPGSGDSTQSTLSNLCVMFRAPENAEDIYSVAQGASRTLKSLTWLSNPSFGSQNACLHILHLPAFTVLSRLAISLALHSETALMELIALLGQTGDGESTIETLEIVCDYEHSSVPDDGVLSTWNWADLDELLASSAYAALRKIKISVAPRIGTTGGASSRNDRYTQSEAALLAFFQCYLPKAHSRKLLITYGDE